MKPNFALQLNETGVTLLKRAPEGWLDLGTASFEASDFNDEMFELRLLAVAAASADLTTKLIIPNDQILYRSIPNLDGSDAQREAAIRAALIDATPYAVEDLRFDWRVSADDLQVAVVAKDTLQEAEDFAIEHGFNPVSFTTMPQANAFSGEPFLGRSAFADSVIGIDTDIDPDVDAMVILSPAEAAIASRDTAPDEPASDAYTPDAQTSSEPTHDELTSDEQKVSATQTADVPEDDAEIETEQLGSSDSSNVTPSLDLDLDLDIDDTSNDEIAPAANADAPETDASTAVIIETTPRRAHSYDIESAAQATPLPQIDDLLMEVSAPPDEDAVDLNEDIAAASVTSPTIQEPLAPTIAPAEPEQVHVPVTSGDLPLDDVSETAADNAVDAIAQDEEPNPDTADETAEPKLEAKADTEENAKVEPSDVKKQTPMKAPAPIPAPPLQPESGEQAAILIHKNDVRARRARRAGASSREQRLLTALDNQKTHHEQKTGIKSTTVAAPAVPTASAPRQFKASKLSPPNAKFSDRIEDQGSAPRPLSLAQTGLKLNVTAGDTAAVITADTQPQAQRRKPVLVGLALTSALVAALLAIGFWPSSEPQTDAQSQALIRADIDLSAAEAPAFQDDAASGLAASSPEDAAVVSEPEEFEVASIPSTSSLPPVLNAAPTSALALNSNSSTASDPDSNLAAPTPPKEPLTSAEVTRQNNEADIWQIAPETAVESVISEAANNADVANSADVAISAVESDTPETLDAASIDQNIEAQDTVSLPVLRPQSISSSPDIATPPAPSDATYDLDERGLVRATPEGSLTPSGVQVFAGRPEKVSPPRPEASKAVLSTQAPEAQIPETQNPENLALAAFTPTLRPSDIIERPVQANVGSPTLNPLSAFRPTQRPIRAEPEVEPNVAPQELGEVAPERTAPVVIASRYPQAKPRNLARLAQAAQAAALAAAQPAPDTTTTRNSAANNVTASVPRTAIPSSTATTVARAATVENAINLRKVNLMGVYGSKSERRALIRMGSGRLSKVEVGDRVDGGRVQSISDSSLVYIKNGRSLTLTVGG